MANKTDTSTTFRIVAVLAAVLLLIAAALVFLKGGGGGSSSAELAALSQAVPSQAGSAVRGVGGAYDELSASVTRLAELRRSAGSSAPGSSAQWQALMSRASAILTARDDVEALFSATTVVADRADAIVQMSDGLLDRSGSTAIMQQFQQRADNTRQLATTLAQSPNAADAAAIGDNIAFLRGVANGLSGEESEFDIRPLNDEARETTLLPILSDLADLETQSSAVAASVHAVIGLATPLTELQTAATALGRAFVGTGSAGSLSAITAPTCSGRCFARSATRAMRSLRALARNSMRCVTACPLTATSLSASIASSPHWPATEA